MGYVLPPPPALHQIHATFDVGNQFLRSAGQSGPSAPIRLNLDRRGMPRDYATYVWLLYKKVVKDESPERLAFLAKPDDGNPLPDLGQQVAWR